MTHRDKADAKLYYFVDIDLSSRQIVGWNIESRDRVEVQLSNGCYRIFLSKGQYNKLVSQLEQSR